MTNPSAVKEAERQWREALAEAKRREKVWNSLLPVLPDTVLADLDTDEQAQCPYVDPNNGAPCAGHLYGYAETDEVSPVLGWGPSEIFNYNKGVMSSTPVDKALWFGDYEFGEQSDPISIIRCTNGHHWQVPAHTDRNV